MRPSRGPTLGLVLVIATACTNGEVVDRTAVLCVEPTAGATLDPSATLAGTSGGYDLVMTATTGEQAGESVRAELTLVEHEPELQMLRAPDGTVRAGARAPLYGWTDLDPTELGAFEMGGLDTEDPTAPGVGVYETRPLTVTEQDPASPSILLRLGSAANRRDVTPVDGAFTALRVTRIDDDGFAGTWESATATVRASGWFCAVRNDPR